MDCRLLSELMDTDQTPEKTRKYAFILTLAKYIVYLAVFLVALQLGQLWLQRDVVVGKAPPLQSVDLVGKRVSLTEYAGEPLLLYFWASWCPVCRFEHGVITALAEDYNVLSIALQSGTGSDVSSHMQEHEADYRVINDPDGIIGSQYGIRGVPTMFLLDSQGNIHSALSGYTSGLGLRLRLWLLSSTASQR
jgi:thiol-disulfide isomerase/thioredoxin